MMTEYWFGRVWRTRWKENPSKEKAIIGILSFEVASLMKALVALWQSLSDDRIVVLSSEVLNLAGIRRLVSDDENYLLCLALAEMLDQLGFVAQAVARLGKLCSNPALWGLKAVFDNLVKKNDDPHGWEFRWTKMERKVKKMETFVAVSKSLYEGMETLSKLEKGLKEIQGSNENDQVRANLQLKIVQQRQVVKTMQDNSLWSRSYNYTVRLLLRSVFTVFRRIKHVFKIDHLMVAATGGDLQVLNHFHLPLNWSYSSPTLSSVYPSKNNHVKLPSIPSCTLICTNTTGTQLKRLASERNRPLRGCIGGGIEDQSSVSHSSKSMSNGYIWEGIFKESAHVESLVHSDMSFFNPKCRLMSNPPPLTLGAAALELCYANVIVVIEKFATCPHSIALDEREELYHMLPASIRHELRKRLKSYLAKNQAHDAGLVAEWTDKLERILEWLAPLAYNTIRWQSQRTLELQQHLVLRKNVLLLQTLYFADHAKTEAVITELLVGLSFICRFQEEESILKAASCINFGSFGDYLNTKR